MSSNARSAETPMAAEKSLLYDHDEQEYIDAGIQIQRSDGASVEFYLDGARIERRCADQVVDFFNQYGRTPSGQELPRF